MERFDTFSLNNNVVSLGNGGGVAMTWEERVAIMGGRYGLAVAAAIEELKPTTEQDWQAVYNRAVDACDWSKVS